MTDNEQQHDIGEDDDLLPMEKQFTITGTKDDARLFIHSDIASVTRWLMRHPAADVEPRFSDGQVVGCKGTIPIGLVSLKAKPRKSDHYSRMVSSASLRELEP